VSSADETNPYRSPDSEGVSGAGRLAYEPTEIERLEIRIAELERRIDRSRLLNANFFVRSLSILGYWLVGYCLVVLVIYPIALLCMYLFSGF